MFLLLVWEPVIYITKLAVKEFPAGNSGSQTGSGFIFLKIPGRDFRVPFASKILGLSPGDLLAALRAAP
jgi:hypothetical protein